MKLPAMQFYPGDWHKDLGVRTLTLEEKGFWFELLLLMFDSEDRGKLTLNGAALTEEDIAIALGLDKQIASKHLANLLAKGVASREKQTGAIYCRRMVRDEKLRKTRSECGKRGGNPVLLNQNGSKTEANRKQNPTPSSSSSSSSSDNTQRARENPDQPTAAEIETTIAGMKQRHAKKDGLGGMLLEQAVCGILGSAVDPRSTLAAIDARHRLGCEREWAEQQPRFWPNLVRWVNDGRWMDPPPEEYIDEAMRLAMEEDKRRGFG